MVPGGETGGCPAPKPSQEKIPDWAWEGGCLCISNFNGYSIPQGPVKLANSDVHGLGWAWDSAFVDKLLGDADAASLGTSP